MANLSQLAANQLLAVDAKLLHQLAADVLHQLQLAVAALRQLLLADVQLQHQLAVVVQLLRHVQLLRLADAAVQS